MPHGGLALANSLATALEGSALFVLMRRRLGGLEGANLFRGFLQAGLATLGMSLAVSLWLMNNGSIWLIGLGGVALGSLVYGLLIWLMKVPEFHFLIRGILRRLKPAA